MMPYVWLVIFFVSLHCFHGTAQTIYQPDFDCVDIYKQPAFAHPLLKNHKIQIEPSEKTTKTTSQFGESKDLCPDGQVPIQKAKFEYQNYQIMTPEFPGQHFAALETNGDGKTLYLGASAKMSVHFIPRVENNAYTRASIWVENGPTDKRNSIQVGWAVHPRIYGGISTRLTAFWTADGYKKTGCYNTLCPGFVQVDKEIYLGGQILTRNTGKPGPQHEPNFSIYLDGGRPNATGNWVLKFDDTIVGYWPKELFTDLAKGATFIRYGGNTFTSPGGVSPAMGSEKLPASNPSFYTVSGFFTHCKYSPQGYESVDISSDAVHTVADVPSCYNINYFQSQIPNVPQTFSYGGPGGQCGN